MTPLRSLLCTALVLALPAVAPAACTDTRDANAVVTTIKKTASCHDKVLSGGACTRPVPPPPACSDTLASDAIALAYGPNDPPAGHADGRDLADQRACQKQIGKGVADYAKALGLIIRGRTPEQAEAIARRSLDKVLTRCAVAVAAASAIGACGPVTA